MIKSLFLRSFIPSFINSFILSSDKMLKMKEQSEAHHKQMLSALNKGDDAAIVGTFMKLAKENQLTK